MCRKITSHWQPLFSKKMAVAASFSYKICGGGLIFLQNWQWRPHFPTKLAAAASFSYKIGGGGKDLATLLAAVLTWSGYWISNNYTINHYKCRLAIIHQSIKEIFDFMHLYRQYYN